MFPLRKVGIGGDEEEEQAADPVGCENELLAAVNVYRRESMRAPEPGGQAKDGPGEGGDEGKEKEKEKERRRSEHRETERLRRQEMSSLFSSLRSLLPLHSFKGKRSMSEHIDLTAKYVKQLESRIKELGDIREQLLTPPSSSSSTTTMNNCHVEVFQDGLVHVQIICGEAKLSMSLKVLLQAGLNVLSCLTARLTQGPYLHTIHCQTNGEPWDNIRVEQLRYRLNELV